MIFHNQKTAYTVNNILIIIMGFLGGSYVPICLVKSSKITRRFTGCYSMENALFHN